MIEQGIDNLFIFFDSITKILVNFQTLLRFFPPCFTSSLAICSTIHYSWKGKLVHNLTLSEDFIIHIHSGFSMACASVLEPVNKVW